jgi:hypothetical protein
LNIAQIVTVDLTLPEVGGVTEQITVSAEASPLRLPRRTAAG